MYIIFHLFLPRSSSLFFTGWILPPIECRLLIKYFLSSLFLEISTAKCAAVGSHFRYATLSSGESSRPLSEQRTCRTCSRSRRLSAVKSGEDAEESPSVVTLHVMCLQPETGLISSAHLYGTRQGRPGNKACLSIYGVHIFKCVRARVCVKQSQTNGTVKSSIWICLNTVMHHRQVGRHTPVLLPSTR